MVPTTLAKRLLAGARPTKEQIELLSIYCLEQSARQAAGAKTWGILGRAGKLYCETYPTKKQAAARTHADWGEAVVPVLIIRI